MRMLLVLLLLVTFFENLFNTKLGLSTGLSATNILTLLGLTGLVFELARKQEIKIPALSVTLWLLLVGVSAMFSVLVGVYGFQHSGYKLVPSLLVVQSEVINGILLFIIFMLIPRRRDETLSLLGLLFGIVAVGNLLTVTDALGLTSLFPHPVRAEGPRAPGLMGEHNQHGAFVVTFLPALIFAGFATSGWRRYIWWAGATISFAALLFTASRGAIVGLLLSCVVGVIVFRRRFTLAIALKGVVAGFALVGVVVAFVVPFFGDVLWDRFVGQSTNVDIGQATSGRVPIWRAAFGLMLDEPKSFIAGFGWRAYHFISTEAYLPHNTYLSYLFATGIVGVTSFVMVLRGLLAVARERESVTDELTSLYLRGFYLGFVALAGAIFFVELFAPWPYVWAYAGLIMRLSAFPRSDSSAE